MKTQQRREVQKQKASVTRAMGVFVIGRQ